VRSASCLRSACLLTALLILAGCREYRFNTLQRGTTSVVGAGKELVVVRDAATFELLVTRAIVGPTGPK
jgi:hypothetical protein